MTSSCKRVVVLHEAMLVVWEESWILDRNKQQRHAAIGSDMAAPLSNSVQSIIIQGERHKARRRKILDAHKTCPLQRHLCKRAHVLYLSLAFFGHHCTLQNHVIATIPAQATTHPIQEQLWAMRWPMADGRWLHDSVVGGHNSQINCKEQQQYNNHQTEW